MDRTAFKNKLKDEPFAVLGEIVYQHLFEQITTLKLLPGDKLNESQLAKDLEISRSPVHTAMNRLIEEQLIVKEEGKFPYVSLILPEDGIRIAQARVLIESNAAYLACPIITKSQLNNIKMYARKYEECLKDPDLTGFEVADHDFHSAFVYACGNPYFIEMYQCVQSRILRYRYYLRYRLGTEALRKTLAESVRPHYTFCHMLEAGMSSALRDEMARHADSMRDAFAKW